MTVKGEDGFEELCDRWAAADAVIYSVPVYHLGISGQLKCFIDRLGNSLWSYYGGVVEDLAGNRNHHPGRPYLCRTGAHHHRAHQPRPGDGQYPCDRRSLGGQVPQAQAKANAAQPVPDADGIGG